MERQVTTLVIKATAEMVKRMETVGVYSVDRVNIKISASNFSGDNSLVRKLPTPTLTSSPNVSSIHSGSCNWRKDSDLLRHNPGPCNILSLQV